MGINNFHGEFVGRPNASLLKKLPHLPIDWPRIKEGIIKSRIVLKCNLFDLQNINKDIKPPIKAPWIAIPPSHIARKDGSLIFKFRK